MLRLITKKRLRQIEQIERINDLRFFRSTAEEAIEQVDITIQELRNSYGTPSSNYEHIPEADIRDEIADLTRLRANLRCCLWRMGGPPALLSDAAHIDNELGEISPGGTA